MPDANANGAEDYADHLNMQEANMTELRMDAYYYGFTPTGVPEIDKILSAVACAGKSYHHTEEWNDNAGGWVGHSGDTPVQWIQNAANEAAAALKRS